MPQSTTHAHHLEDRRAQAVRARAAERQLDLTVAQHDRGGHHAGHPGSRREAVESERVQVLLAEHVVQVDAGPRSHDAGAGAVRAGDADGVAVRVQRGDVRRRPERAPRPPACRPLPTRAATSRRRALEASGRQELGCEPVLVQPVVEVGPRASAASAITSTNSWSASGSSNGAGSPSRSSRSSANAIRMPPDDGGGLVSTSRPRNAAITGCRSTTS